VAAVKGGTLPGWMREGEVTVTVRLPRQVYEILEEVAFAKGVSVENIVFEAVRTYAFIVRDVADYYKFALIKLQKDAERLVEIAAARGVIASHDKAEVERKVAALAELVILLKEVYTDLPREVKAEDLERDRGRLREALLKLIREGSVRPMETDPVRFVENRLAEIESIAPAFNIEVVKEGGAYAAVKFNNRNLLEPYAAYKLRIKYMRAP